MGRMVYLVPLSDAGRGRLDIVKDHLERSGMKWEELSCDDIRFRLTEPNKNIYVCDPMEGDAYDKLINIGCTVSGCGAIVSSLALKTNFPRKRRTKEVGGLFSLALHTCEICVTNVPKENRESLMMKAMRMGAKVSPNMSTSVTHLIVGEVNSKKYIVASENKIMTVTPKWVDDLWNRSGKLFYSQIYEHQLTHILYLVKQLEPMNAMSQNFLDITRKCHCPIFYGCGFSVSNISSDKRTDLANLIITHGGCYMGQMDKNKCTHLIVGSAGGKKYQYAKKWGITIVPHKWIKDSIERGFALSTELPEYQVNCSEER